MKIERVEAIGSIERLWAGMFALAIPNRSRKRVMLPVEQRL